VSHLCPPFLIVNIHFYLSVFVTVSMLLLGFLPLNANVLALGAVADFGAQNCQYTTKFDAR